MAKQTTYKITSIKTPLSRKLIIAAGAATGLIIAGVIALSSNAEVSEEIEVTEDATED